VVRNVTFSLPVELIREAKILAAKQDKSLNAIVRESLEQAVESDRRYQEAGRRILERAKEDLFEAKPWRWNRDEIYDRCR
jgi:plasmid stability protein